MFTQYPITYVDDQSMFTEYPITYVDSKLMFTEYPAPHQPCRGAAVRCQRAGLVPRPIFSNKDSVFASKIRAGLNS